MKIWKYIIYYLLFLILMFSIIIPKLRVNHLRNIEQSIEEEIKKQASELMKDEIIRQLKEKEGKTIDDYYVEEFFRKKERLNEKDF